jgi:hypothetical protein
LSQFRFGLGDVERELRDKHQVLAVVDYIRRGPNSSSPHWVLIEKVDTGTITRADGSVYSGRYVVVGDPGVGKSVAIPEADFMRHWRPEATVIAMPPPRGAANLPPVASTPPLRGPPSAGVRPGAPGLGVNSAPVPDFMVEARAFLQRTHGADAATRRMDELIDYCDFYLTRSRRGLDPVARRAEFADLVDHLEDLPERLVWPFIRRLRSQAAKGEFLLGGSIDLYVPPGLDFPTTTNAMRRYANSATYRDPLDFRPGGEMRLPPLGRVAPDHILPVSWIVNAENSPRGLRRFNELTRENQMKVIHDLRNIQPLKPEMNLLKSDHTIERWNELVDKKYGRGLSDAYREWLERQQTALKKQLQATIDELLANQPRRQP